MEDCAFLQIGKKLWNKSEGQAVSARGASGGNKYSKIKEAFNTHWLLTKLQKINTKEILCLFNVYVPVSAREKKVYWDSIRTLADSENLENVIIAGDLNLILSLTEKRGGSIVRDPAREWVEDLLQDWDMIDIKPSSGKYTWSNKRVGSGHIAARLDRFIVQSSFLLFGLESRMHILPCSVSDHRPIKLELLSHLDQGPIPFKFSPQWVKEPTFMHMVKESWNRPVKGSAFFVWEEKLRRVKAALKNWVKSLPNPAVERKKIQESLEIHHLKSKNEEITK